MATTPAGGLLARQLKQMQGDKDIPGISCGVADGNIFEWEVMLMINDDCRFYGGKSRAVICTRKAFFNAYANNTHFVSGGLFRARLSFPPEYPLLPPQMKFETPIFHPNSTPFSPTFAWAGKTHAACL